MIYVKIAENVSISKKLSSAVRLKAVLAHAIFGQNSIGIRIQS